MEEEGVSSFAWQQRHGRAKETENSDTQQATGNSADNKLHGLLQGSGVSPQQIMPVADFLPDPFEYFNNAGLSLQGARRVFRTSYWSRMERRMTAMLDGIWPGLEDKLLLFCFILRHLDKCYNSCIAFLMWRDIKLAESPSAYIRVRDWQRANTRKSGVSWQLDNIGDGFALHLVRGTHYPPHVIHTKFHLKFGRYTRETNAAMGKVSKTEEEEENNAPVADVEAVTAIHGSRGWSGDWGEEDTSRLDSSNYKQGYLGVVHYVKDTAIVDTASSNTLRGSRMEGSTVPRYTDTPSSISMVPVLPGYSLCQGNGHSPSSLMAVINKNSKPRCPISTSHPFPPPSPQSHALSPQKSDDGYLSGRGASP